MSRADRPQAPSCPSCGGPTEPYFADRRVRRGDRAITFQALYWECQSEAAIDGEGPLRLEDAVAAAYNLAVADLAWREAYGVPFPDARPPGPPARQTERVHIRMSRKDLARLDRLAVARESTRSQVVRQLVRDASVQRDAEPSQGLQQYATRAANRPEILPLLARQQ